MAANLSSLPNSQLKSMAVPYPSPPSSPCQTKSPTSHVPKVSEDQARPSGTVSLAQLGPPRAHLHCSSEHVEPKENKADVSDLKIRLGLDSGLCGGRKLSGQSCRLRSLAANKARIVSQLGLMVDLTQSSPELDSALSKLVKLVHCRHHDSGVPEKSRIDSWITEFPIGEADTDPKAWIEKQITKSLELVSAQCIGVETSTESRCRYSIGGQRVQNCAATIAEICRPEVYLNDAYLDGLLRVLETNMFCPLHINKQPLKMVVSWKTAIGGIRGKQLIKPVETDAPRRMSSSQPTDTQAPDRPPSRNGDVSTLQSEELSIPNFRGDLSTFWQTAYNNSHFDILPKSDGPTNSQSSYDRIRSKMMSELVPDDLGSGYVYAYEAEGNSGYVKIGYTARSVEVRCDEWKFECNRVPKVLYPLTSSTDTALANARRVEALCHAELDDRRTIIYCKACLKKHREWFEVPVAEAIAVIQKWSKWIATRPYQSIELRSTVKWTIREEERKRTLDMDCFMREISEDSKLTMTSESKEASEAVAKSILSTDTGDSQSHL